MTSHEDTQKDWAAVEVLFSEALKRSPSDRTTFLEGAEADPQVLAQVRDLLRIAEESTGFLEPPGIAVTVERQTSPETGEFIGPYRIGRLLGMGGMGSVYLAEQANPNRRVALKILHGSRLTESAKRRFAFESEVLARLKHRGIAQVYQTGIERSDDEGGVRETPYFAMEWVEDAEELLAYVQRTRPTLRRKLLLFVEVCRAVQHAHEQGIIHRDLKPGNILVDREGHPKVIDFGVARAVEPGSEPALTMHGEVFGTLRYMSPEQLSGVLDAVDTRTDVYALGIVLYEMLTGASPFDIEGKNLGEAMALLSHAEPRPLRGWVANLPLELEWVVSKAIRREHAERYAAVSELIADVLRFLDDEPVLAGPLGRVYRARKFLRRHRVLVGSTLLVIASLSAGLILSLSLYREASDARDVAREKELQERRAREELQRQYERTEDVRRFLVSVLESTNPFSVPQDTTVTELLDAAALRLEHERLDDVETLYQLHLTLAQSYQEVGSQDKARHHALRGLEILRTEHAEDDPRVLFARVRCVMVRSPDHPVAEARAELLQLIEISERPGVEPGSCDKVLACAYSTLADLAKQEGDLAEAERLARRALEFDQPEEEVLLLASILLIRGEVDRAEEILRAFESRVGDRPILLGDCLRTLGVVASWKEHFEEAREHLEGAIACYEQVYLPHHFQLLASRASLAMIYKRLGREEEAERAYREILVGCEGRDLVEESIRLVTRFNLATMLRQDGRREEAAPLYEAAVAGATVHLEPYLQIEFRLGFAAFLAEDGRFDDAEEHLVVCRELVEGARGLDPSYARRVQQSFEVLRTKRREGR